MDVTITATLSGERPPLSPNEDVRGHYQAPQCLFDRETFEPGLIGEAVVECDE